MTTTRTRTRQTGGDKRSSWETFQRRLGVVRRLIRGPATPETLIAAVKQTMSDETFPPDARSALRHDLAALRREFGCVITFRAGFYTLEDLGRLALLDLADEELEALAFLGRLAAESALPNAAHLVTLLGRITSLLPPERQQQLARIPNHPQVEVPAPVYDPPAHTLATLKRALARQQICFGYRSPYQGANETIQHRVAPYRLFHRDGHTYLEAYCYECDLESLDNRYLLYRLNRIVPETLRVLPQCLPPVPPPRPAYALRYVLAPDVACQQDISLWFDESRVTFQPDGSALVEAQTPSLWQARQVILRYREHCRVLEPPELVQMIRETLDRMNEIYQEEVLP
ncbi:MAG: WYL domain-containing protein [Chloroflexaceae bacterium]|nr:WYL domain-containing protein [Chloroflexaceae bacterium]